MRFYSLFFLIVSVVAGSYGPSFDHGAAALTSALSFTAFVITLIAYAAKSGAEWNQIARRYHGPATN